MSLSAIGSTSTCFSVCCSPCILLESTLLKTMQVFTRCLDSHLFWGLILLGAVCSFAYAAITGAIVIESTALGFYLLLGVIAVVLYVAHYWKQLRAELSSAYRLVENWVCGYEWISQVTHHLYLSGIPRKNYSDHETIKAKKIGTVVSINQKWELKKRGIFLDPVTPDDWKAMKIQQRILEVPDYTGVPADKIHIEVEELRKVIFSGSGHSSKKVLVHCYAGKGRSATIVLGYLLKYGEQKSIDQAIKVLKKIRPQVNLNAEQIGTLTDYHKRYVLARK